MSLFSHVTKETNLLLSQFDWELHSPPFCTDKVLIMIWKLLIKSALLYKQWHQYKISACLINHKYALVWGSTWCLSWKGYTSDCFKMQDKLFMSLLPTVAYCYKAQCKVCMIVTIGYFFGVINLSPTLAVHLTLEWSSWIWSWLVVETYIIY